MHPMTKENLNPPFLVNTDSKNTLTSYTINYTFN